MPVEIGAWSTAATDREQEAHEGDRRRLKGNLEALRQEIAEVQEKLNVQKAGWLNQKNAIDHVQEQGTARRGQSEEEREARNGVGRCVRRAIRDWTPQRRIQDSEAALEAQKQLGRRRASTNR